MKTVRGLSPETMTLFTGSNLTSPPSQRLVHHSSKVTGEVVNINQHHRAAPHCVMSVEPGLGFPALILYG